MFFSKLSYHYLTSTCLDTFDTGIKKVNLIFPDYTLSEKIIPFPFDKSHICSPESYFL